MQGKKGVRVTEVPLAAASLNSGDVFVADLGERIFVWAGAACNPDEKVKALEVVEARRADRNGQVEVCNVPIKPFTQHVAKHLHAQRLKTRNLPIILNARWS